MAFIPYGRQSINQDDVDAVTDVMRGDYLTTGPKVAEFESAFGAVCQSPYTVVCSNGTTALQLAAEAIGLGKGDCAIVQSLTFLATANAMRFTGADVVFCDVDPETGLMTADLLRKAIARVPKHLKLKAVLPVHLAGICVDLKSIREIADEHNLKIIADSCHATGGVVNGHPVGACVYEDFATFSFHPVKTIAMGEGGAITCRSEADYNFMRRKRSHGMDMQPDNPILRDEGYDTHGNKNPWYYEMPDIGYNFRATDMQCALGISQLKRLDDFVKRRAEIVARYNQLFADVANVETPNAPEYNNKMSWHLYAPRFDFDAIGKTRAQVMNELRAKEILTQVHYFPVHLQPYYRDLYGEINLPGARSYYDKTLSLPLYPDLTDEHVDYVAQSVIEAISQ